MDILQYLELVPAEWRWIVESTLVLVGAASVFVALLEKLVGPLEAFFMSRIEGASNGYARGFWNVLHVIVGVVMWLRPVAEEVALNRYGRRK